MFCRQNYHLFTIRDLRTSQAPTNDFLDNSSQTMFGLRDLGEVRKLRRGVLRGLGNVLWCICCGISAATVGACSLDPIHWSKACGVGFVGVAVCCAKPYQYPKTSVFFALCNTHTKIRAGECEVVFVRNISQ